MVVGAHRSRPVMQEEGIGAWWHGIPSVTVTIECGEATHRLTWQRGELVVEDHDTTAERALAAMGGTLPDCIAVLDAWLQAGADPYLVSVWDGQPISAVMPTGPTGTFTPFIVPSRRSVATTDWLELQQRRSLLRKVPAELYDRLALGVVAALCAGQRHAGLGGLRQWSPIDLGPPVSARAIPLLHKSVASWRGPADSWTAPVVQCHIADPDEGASVDGLVERRGGWVEAALGPGWLVEVWGRGVALVDGCFVLAATAGAGEEGPVDAVAVRWERIAAGGLEPITGSATLTPGAKGWRLHWS